MDYVDSDLVSAVTQHESSWNPSARGAAGEVGLMQLMPENVRKFGVEDPEDPVQNLTAGISLLQQELEYFNGDERLALAAYNAGRGNVNRAAEKAGSYDFDALSQFLPLNQQKGIDTRGYVNSVMGIYGQMKSGRTEQSQQNETSSDDSPWGVPSDFVEEVENLVTQDGFDDLPTEQKIRALSRLYDSRKWVPEVDPILKEVSSSIWGSASPEEVPNLGEIAAPYLAQIEGQDEDEISERGLAAREEFGRTVREGGVHPNLFGPHIDNLFNDKIKDEQARTAAKNRGVVGTVGRGLAEFGRGAVEGYTMAAAALPNLYGFTETGQAIESVPKDIFGETREFDFETDDEGNVVRDEYGEPITRYRGTVIRGLGQMASLLAGGALLKTFGYGTKAIQGFIGGVNSLSAIDASYTETIQEGGTHQDGLLAAVVTAPIAGAASLLDASIIASGRTYITALTGMNRARAVGRVVAESALKGGTGNLLTEIGIAGGASAGLDENRFTAERLGIAFGVGAVPGGAFGALESRAIPRAIIPDRTTVVQPPLPPDASNPPESPPPPPDSPTGGVIFRDSRQKAVIDETQTRLAQEFEKFQKSSRQQVELDIPNFRDIPKDLLEIFQYDAAQTEGGKVIITKRESYQPHKGLPGTLRKLDQERQRLAEEISDSPHPEGFQDLLQARTQLKREYAALEKMIGEEIDDSNSLAHAKRALKSEMKKNRIRREKLSDAYVDTDEGLQTNIDYQQILDLEHADLVNQLAQIDESLSKTAEKKRAVELREELADVNDQLKRLSDPKYVNDLKAKERRLIELGDERKKLLQKETEFVEQQPFKEIAVKVKTDFGDRFALPFQDKWYLFDPRGNVLTDGHWNLKDAIDVAKRLDESYATKIGRKFGATRRQETFAPVADKLARTIDNPFSDKPPSPDAPPVAPPDEGIRGLGKEGEAAAGARSSAPDETIRPETKISPDSQTRLRQSRPNIPVGPEFIGEQRFVNDPTARTGQKPVAITELMDRGRRIIAAIQSGPSIGVYEGGRIRPGVRGYFAFNKNIIRLGRINDPTTLTHEFAHAIDKYALSKWDTKGMGDYSALPPEVRRGLTQTAQTFYPAPLTNPNVQLAEGFSMFVQHYVTGQAVHRDVLNWYKTQFSEIAPREFRAIEGMKDLSHEYYSQTPQAEATAFRGAKPKSLTKRGMDYFEEGIWKDDFIDRSNFWGLVDKATGSDIQNRAHAQSNTVDHRADYLINHGLRDYIGNTVSGRALRDHIEVVQKAGKLDTWTNYMTMKRFKERYVRNGIEPGIALETIDAVIADVEANHADVKTAAYGWWDSWGQIVEGLKQSSPVAERYITALQEENLRLTGAEHGFYVPIQRAGKGQIKLGTNIQGSYRTVENFLDHVKPHLRGMLMAADRQEVLHYFLSQLRDPLMPSGVFGMEVTNEAIVKKLDAEMKEKVAHVLGTKDVNAEITGDYEFSESPETENFARNAVAFLDPQLKSAKASDGFVFIGAPDADGKMHYYEIAERGWQYFSDRTPEMYNTPWFNIVFKAPKKALQLGATALRPAWVFPNTARDLQTLWRRTGIGNPITSSMMLLKYIQQGIHQTVLGKIGKQNLSGWSERARGWGLQGATRLASEGYLERLNSRGWKVTDFADTTFAKIAEFASTMEESLRLSAMIEKANQLGLSPTDRVTREQAMELILAYRRSTTDFGVQGRLARRGNLWIPFFTARIAEVAQVGRDIREHPGKLASQASAWLAFGLYYAWAHKDDDWYKEMNPEERGKFVHMPFEKGEDKRLFRMPMDGWSSNFFLTGQALASQMHETGEVKPEMSEFAGAVIKGNLPLGLSFDSLRDFAESSTELGGPLVKEFIQQLANRDYYFRKDIVPKALVKSRPEDQYTQYTTEVAKTIGEELGWSPARVEHLMKLFPVSVDAARVIEDLTGVKRPPGTEKEGVAERLIARMTESGLRYGMADGLFTRSKDKFYDTLEKFTLNKDSETPEERRSRLRLNEIHQRVTAIDTVMSQAPKEERKKLSESQSKLFDEAFEIAKGKTDIQLEPAPKAEAKRIKAERSAEKVKRREERGRTLFED